MTNPSVVSVGSARDVKDSFPAAENFQHERLSAIETIEAIVEIMDADLIENKEYASMGKILRIG